ncbi:MAG: hypothetical protein KBD16_03910 [Candidatus Pacebacteria bacterium]|nr:hypothetical protein [Candidatus Paceibacterota bacterium]
MPRNKLIAAVLVAVAILLACGSAAQAQFALDDKPGFSGVTLGVIPQTGAGLGSPAWLFEGGVGYSTTRTTIRVFGWWSGADKAQTKGYFYEFGTSFAVKVTKRSSLVVALTDGCFKGELFDSCAQRAQLDWCTNPGEVEFCFGGVGPLNDAHNYGNFHVVIKYEVIDNQFIGMGLFNGWTAVQGVAGMPGFDPVNGMSNEQFAQMTVNATYKVTFDFRKD